MVVMQASPMQWFESETVLAEDRVAPALVAWLTSVPFMLKRSLELGARVLVTRASVPVEEHADPAVE